MFADPLNVLFADDERVANRRPGEETWLGKAQGFDLFTFVEQGRGRVAEGREISDLDGSEKVLPLLPLRDGGANHRYRGANQQRGLLKAGEKTDFQITVFRLGVEMQQNGCGHFV